MGRCPIYSRAIHKSWDSCPEHTVSQYLKLFGQAEYARLHWATYQERWKKAIEDGQDKLLHPLFNQEELDRLRKSWGSTYSDEELYQLEDLYTGMKNSFGISDPTREDNAKKMCKISKEIDRCIANGSVGLDKLVSSYSKLQELANFHQKTRKILITLVQFPSLRSILKKLDGRKNFIMMKLMMLQIIQ